MRKIREDRYRREARARANKEAKAARNERVLQGLFDAVEPAQPAEPPAIEPKPEYAHLIAEQQARMRALIPDDEAMQDKVTAARMKRLEAEKRGRAWLDGQIQS
jgi:hypothetical protein